MRISKNLKTGVLLFVLMLITVVSLHAQGQNGTADVEEKENKVIEEIKAEGGEYAVFEAFRVAADNLEEYPGLPGEGKKLGFANIYGTLPFCISVEESIERQAELAGFSEKNVFIMDNQYDSSIGLKNADIMLSKNPDVFIEFQADAKVNSIISQKFSKADIPIIAVDVPIPGAPFMGIDNWNVSYMAGEEIARQIKEQWGGIEQADLIVLLQNPVGGENLMDRSEGAAAALVDIFGSEVKEKIFRVDGGAGQSDQAKTAMDDVLSANPKAEKIAFTGLNDQMAAGGIASLQGSGRWSEDDIILVTLGVDELGQTLIRSEQADAGVAFLPENYGRYCVPAAVAAMLDEPVPENIYIDNKVITKDNIDEYYPE
ncbi:MAG: sugar ABC transporter substrate-binding protein [Spirochaetia bacterium]|nr:sugar ABC transporter substrate-binding protein [Spirochaetia bacterium]MCF7945850.1 sugar ABC transporter substrate-binding protein [Spirochaetia bacterium]